MTVSRLTHSMRGFWNRHLSHIPHTKSVAACVVVALGVLVFIVRYLKKSAPPLLGVETKNISASATVKITIPEMKKPPQVALTFCIDTSKSMEIKGRRNDVDKSVNSLIDAALKVMENKPTMQVYMTIVGFNKSAKTILEPTILTKNAAQGIKQAIEKYLLAHGTDIPQGLQKSIKKIQLVKGNHPQLQHSLILLTDGLSKSESNIAIQEIKNNLTTHKVNFFAIGIGEQHDKKLLETLTNKQEHAKYIDASKSSIEEAITKIYQNIIHHIDQITIMSPLESHRWSVDDQQPREEENQIKVDVLTYDRQEIETTICVSEVTSVDDLKKTAFTLVYQMPDGQMQRQKIFPFTKEAV